MENSFINKIVFGNPSKEDHNNISVSNYLDKLFPPLCKYSNPRNNSELTKKELQQLVNSVDSNSENRKKLFDSSLMPFVNDLFVRNGADKSEVEATTGNIINDVLPLVTKLKYFFNRPRPYQLAYYHGNMPLFPYFSHFVSSPSYPSGHSTLAIVTGHVLGNHYPNSWQVMQDFVVEVQESRVLLGVHFPSDNVMAQLTAKQIINYPQFRAKYGL